MSKLIPDLSGLWKKQEPQQAQKDQDPKKLVGAWVSYLETYDTKRLVTHEQIAPVGDHLIGNAEAAGYTALLIKQLILRQLFFTALALGGSTNPVAAWATQSLQLSKSEVETVLAEAQKELDPEAMPEFVGEAPQSVQGAGATMVKVWEGFKIPVEFISGTESGLRHYSLRFKKPPTTKISQIESNLQDALSHGGFHPEIPVIFTFLPHGEFEIHIPKEKDKWQAMSFAEYLVRSIDYRPDGNRGLDLGHFVDSVIKHYHPQANLRKAPEIPIGIDIYGKTSVVQFGAGGIIVGAPNMGKSTHLKLIVIMLMFMLPPSLFKFVAIDLKDLTLKRFTANWRNPWTLASVVTSRNSQQLEAFFKALEREKKVRAKKLSRFGCENWLEYNEKNPSDPMPFSPIIIDEVSLLKDFMDKALADHWIDEISGRWRFVGMPLIAGTQYAADQHSISPTVRQNLETKIAFKASERCAKHAFENTATVNAVASLLGGGDFIAKSAGMSLPLHGQGFDAPGKLIDQFLDVLKSRFPEAPEDQYLCLAEDPEDPWEAEDA